MERAGKRSERQGRGRERGERREVCRRRKRRRVCVCGRVEVGNDGAGRGEGRGCGGGVVVCVGGVIKARLFQRRSAFPGGRCFQRPSSPWPWPAQNQAYRSQLSTLSGAGRVCGGMMETQHRASKATRRTARARKLRIEGDVQTGRPVDRRCVRQRLRTG